MSRYKLEKPQQTNEFIVTIKADSNDGDYISETESYSSEDFEEYVYDTLIDLKSNYGESHKLTDYPNENDLSIPFNGWDGYCHSLESIDVKFIDEFGMTWNVILEEQ